MKLLRFLCVLVVGCYSASYAVTAEQLPLDQQIGQLLVMAVPTNPSKKYMDAARQAFVTYKPGGVIFLGLGRLQQLKEAIDAFKTVACEQKMVPPFFMLDAEWGLHMRCSPDENVTRFPRNMTLGALPANKEHLIKEMAQEIGRQAALLGVQTLAPVADVNNNPANPVIHDRSFGANPQAVARKCALYVEGLQQHVVTCAKHFPGHGDTATDSHIGLPAVNHDRAHLESVELVPFKQLIQNGVDMIMTAHIDVPALTESTQHLPASLSPNVMQLLRKWLNFNGIIISDAMDMGGITKYRKQQEAARDSIIAGTDCVILADQRILKPYDPTEALGGTENSDPDNLYSNIVPQAYALLKAAVAEGTLPAEQLRCSVERILAAKQKAGLYDAKSEQPFNVDQFHTPHAKALKKQLYSCAVTAINGGGKQLIDPKKTLLVQLNGGDVVQPLAKKLQTLGVAVVTAVPEQLPTDKELIVAVHGMNKFKEHEGKQFGMPADVIAHAKKVVAEGGRIVLFGTPYSAQLFDDKAPKLIGYEDDVDAQEAVADIVLGIQEAVGVLPV